MRGRGSILSLALFISTVVGSRLYASSGDDLFLDHDTYINIPTSTSLFLYNAPYRADLFGEVNRYANAPISLKRRGVDWWLLGRVSPSQSGENIQSMQSQVRLSTSTALYRLGASYSGGVERGGYILHADVVGRTGRDLNIEGVFQNSVYATFSATKSFSQGHELELTLDISYLMRGLRTSASQECYTLVGNNLYNPSWGYYHGEVRNSRVLRRLLPSLEAQYSRPLSASTTLTVEVGAEYGTRRISRLGWYDSSNPTPNYYSKMPSYMIGTSVYEDALEVWRGNDTDYTQIGWDKLEEINLSSVDGVAHYVVEDMVERVADMDVKAMFETQISQKLRLSYGAGAQIYNHRNYKQMRDLLGAEYHLDVDQYTDEFTQTGNDLQNNLRSPNRHIVEGDRFGYDYTHHRRYLYALAGVGYHSQNLNLELDITLGESTIYRCGHYEKERFAGSASYGRSSQIELSSYNCDLYVGYTLTTSSSLSLRAGVDSRAPLSRYLFLAEQNNNYTIDDPTTEKVNLLSVGYHHTTSRIRLSVEGYVISSRDMGQVWQSYDDLSATYCDVVISGTSTCSMGLEASFEGRLTKEFTLSASLWAVGCRYTSSPLVRLYDDVDATLLTESRASGIDGCVVGNTPQLGLSARLTYRFERNFTLSLSPFYYAKRYVDPSIIRRTRRIVDAMSSDELRQELLTQERLPNLFNTHLFITKSFTLRNKSRLNASLRVENLLGGENIITSAREANRVISGTTPQASTYEYSAGRSFTLSLGYRL